MIYLSQVFCFLAAVIVMVNSVGVLGRMSPNTDHGIRIAYTMIAIGGFGEMGAVLTGHIPGISETIMFGGIATLCLAERRHVYPAQTKCCSSRIDHV